MKNIKTFESIYSDINNEINFIIEPWRDKLNINNVVTHFETKLVYFDIYENINDETIDVFNSFFNNLNNFNLKWKFTNKSSYSFRIDYKDIDQEKLNLEMKAKTYNL